MVCPTLEPSYCWWSRKVGEGRVIDHLGSQALAEQRKVNAGHYQILQRYSKSGAGVLASAPFLLFQLRISETLVESYSVASAVHSEQGKMAEWALLEFRSFWLLKSRWEEVKQFLVRTARVGEPWLLCVRLLVSFPTYFFSITFFFACGDAVYLAATLVQC